jgi:hypothetical protein
MNASTIASEYGYLFDRTLDETLSLPYQLSSILIPQNELCYSGTINEVFEKLQSNLIYLYSLTKLSDNNIPVNYQKVAGGAPAALASKGFTYFLTSSTASNQLRPLSTYNLSLLDNLIDGKFYPERTLQNNELGFFVTDTHVIVLTSNYENNTIGVFLSTNKIYENSTFEFLNLNSITFDKQNFIYVCDSEGNSIYKYNIENLIVEDDIIGRKILFEDSVGGGSGTYLEKTKFNNPGFINIYENSLYVIDKNNYAIKIFDLNLNWIKTLRFQRYLQDYDITAFRVNENNNLLYFGFENNIGIFTPTLSTIQFFSLSSEVASGENIKDFQFSKVDSNIFYVITEDNIYKKSISKPQYTIGRFLLSENNISVDEFRFGSINLLNDKDLFSIYGINNNAGIFYNFIEDSKYVSILTNNNLDLYTIDEIKVNSEEYAQDWVFSKSLSKILLNILSLRDRIVRRFAGKYDNKGNLLYFGQLYLTDQEINKDEFDYSVNYLVNLNEIFSNSVFNRAINKIYSFETQMLSVLRDTSLNVWPPLSTTVVVS